jgi:hypothetical protein
MDLAESGIIWQIFIKGRGAKIFSELGMDWFVYLKNFNIVVPIKTRDLVPPLPKAQWIFIKAIQLVSKLQIKQQGGALKL